MKKMRGSFTQAARRLWALGLVVLMSMTVALVVMPTVQASGSASTASAPVPASNSTSAPARGFIPVTTQSSEEALQQAQAYYNAAMPSSSHYKTTGQAALGLQDGKVVVYEFFSFTCPHCRDVYEKVHEWGAQNPHLKLVYVPVNWGEQYEPFMRLYYTLEALDHLDWMADAYAAVQDDHHFDTPSLIDWLVSRGVDRSLAVNTFNAFSIGVRLRQATELGKRYAISGTPTFVINGQYLVTPQLFEDMGEQAAYQATLNTANSLVDYVWATQQSTQGGTQK